MRFCFKLLVCVLSCLHLGSASASKSNPPQSAPSTSIVKKSFSIKPGEFAELNLNMKNGSKVSVDYDASEKLSWNVHSHDKTGSVIHKEGTDKAGRESFLASKSGVFSYLWENKGKIVINLSTEVAIDNGVSIHSWHGE